MTPQVEPIEGGALPSSGEIRDGYLVRTDYHPGFVDELKELVPRRDREWWPDSRGWWIAQEHVEGVLELLRERFGEYDLVDETTGEVIRDGRP